ncbi:hypothetical protein LSTR_LSTR004846 [Laodelphax striatellus]|uniref:Uncharacterized protein n=1 Tax=Laodelphax striatellus TaxID=195883 RepID=A0A482WIK2_LAOST|nr:hypothetical protein LSTR_LSTR004846 [Laodelphax striatellus]
MLVFPLHPSYNEIDTNNEMIIEEDNYVDQEVMVPEQAVIDDHEFYIGKDRKTRWYLEPQMAVTSRTPAYIIPNFRRPGPKEPVSDSAVEHKTFSSLPIGILRKIESVKQEMQQSDELFMFEMSRKEQEANQSKEAFCLDLARKKQDMEQSEKAFLAEMFLKERKWELELEILQNQLN